MRSRTWSCLLACVLALPALLGSPQPAAAGSTARAERVIAPLWRELGRPGRKRARALLDQALLHESAGKRQLPTDWRSLCTHTLALSFGNEGLAQLAARARALRELSRQALRRRAQLDGALARLQRASALDPDDPELAYTFARMLMEWESPGPLWTCTSERRDEQAATLLRALRTRHPDFMPEAVAFDLAFVQARRELFAEAAQAYADAIALTIDGEETAVIRTNLAEVTMLSGDLEAAVAHYRHALKQTSGGRDYLLALWGLAVALDRLGEHDAALEQAKKAVDAEGGHMQVLRSVNVFFEPEHEIHAYEGLGHEALASRPEVDRNAELAAAAASYRALLEALGDAPGFGAAARADLERIEAARSALPARGRAKSATKRAP